MEHGGVQVPVKWLEVQGYSLLMLLNVSIEILTKTVWVLILDNLYTQTNIAVGRDWTV